MKGLKIVVPLLLATTALVLVFVLPVGAGTEGLRPKMVHENIPAGRPVDLGAQAIVLAGTDVELVSSSSDASLPEVAANGTFVAVTYAQGSASSKRVMLRASEGTNGWGFAVGVDPSNRQGTTPKLAFRPSSTNTVHIVWRSENDYYIRHAICTLADPLPSCSSVSEVANAGTGTYLGQPDIVVDSNDRVHVAWFDPNGSSPGQIRTKYLNGSWISGISIPVYDDTNAGQVVLATSNNKVHLAFKDLDGSNWKIRYFRLKDDLTSDSAPEEWSTNGADVSDHYDEMGRPAIAASGSNVFLTWDNEYDTDIELYGLVGVQSANDADLWGDVKHITSTTVATDDIASDQKLTGDDPAANIEGALRPSLAITGTDDFAIVWQQRPTIGFCNGGPSENGTSEIYYASHTGNTWSTNGTLAYTFTTYAIDPDLAIDTIGTHVVFMMGADGGGCGGASSYGIYYRGPVTGFSSKGGGVFLPIILKKS